MNDYSLCPYFLHGQCKYRSPPIRCGGHEIFTGLQGKQLTCVSLIVHLLNLVKEERHDDLNDYLTSKNDYLREITMRVLKRNKEKTHGGDQNKRTTI